MVNVIQKAPLVGVFETYEDVELPDVPEQVVSTGWLPPLPDFQDFTEESSDIPEMAAKIHLAPAGEVSKLPTKVDLRKWCSPIENQKRLGSCTAQAAAGIVEYSENRAFGRYINGSRLFVYKTTRQLMGVSGDTGAWLRSTMGALATCGIPPEKYWPYTDRKQPGPAGERTFDADPPSFVYAIADNFEALRYFCHDPIGRSVPPENVLHNVKRFLAAGVPSMFGFFGFRSANYGSIPGAFPFPCPGERATWGHAVVAVGYDDTLKIKNKKCSSSKETTGALMIRNSWGTAWGNQGYGWIPYDYVLKRLALDFWSLLRMGWVDTGHFGL